jgi:hypothetical protein
MKAGRLWRASVAIDDFRRLAFLLGRTPVSWPFGAPSRLTALSAFVDGAIIEKGGTVFSGGRLAAY